MQATSYHDNFGITMKTVINLLWLALALPVCCFGKMLYVVQPSHSSNKLTVRVNRTTPYGATRLILRGTSFGVASQVSDVICDGRPIQKSNLGIWLIPQGCRHLQWQISLKEKDNLANAQQSVKLHNFMLLSEASSFPHLSDAIAPIVNITSPLNQT